VYGRGRCLTIVPYCLALLKRSQFSAYVALCRRGPLVSHPSHVFVWSEVDKYVDRFPMAAMNIATFLSATSVTIR
jgi:hypothetical protein